MPVVYLLYHSIPRGEHEDNKLIGVYSTAQNADAAIQRLKDKPGFRDPSGTFTVDAYPIDQDHWAEGFGIDPDR